MASDFWEVFTTLVPYRIEILLLPTLCFLSILGIEFFRRNVFPYIGAIGCLVIESSGCQFLLSRLNSLLRLSMHPFWNGLPSFLYEPLRFSLVVSFLQIKYWWYPQSQNTKTPITDEIESMTIDMTCFDEYFLRSVHLYGKSLSIRLVRLCEKCWK